MTTSVAVDRARADRKTGITRWNRRLGWALVFTFPFSYFASWLNETYPDGTLGSWLSLLNVLAQVIGTVVLLTHAAYSFYVFGFPAPRWNLRAVNGYLAYAVLLVYLLSQSAGPETAMHDVLTYIAFALITGHVLLAWRLARQRPAREEPTLREDTRALLSPDAQPLEEIRALSAARTEVSDAPALECQRLDVDRGRVQVLYGVGLTVSPGEVVALLGNNGAGKTTTLRALAGLQPVRTGRVLLDGFEVSALSPAGRSQLGLGLVIGGDAVFGPLTVTENLRMFGYGSAEGDELERRIARVQQMFPWMADRASQTASTLSGGEQQMLAVSQALISTPRVLLIDEFSLGLAPRIVGQLMELVHAIADQGTAVLLVEQSVNVATQLADRLYVMERGRIVLEEPAQVLRDNPDRLAAVYLQGTIDAEVDA